MILHKRTGNNNINMALDLLKFRIRKKNLYGYIMNMDQKIVHNDHVLIGNLDIIHNQTLRDVMRYSTKYIIKRILTKNSQKTLE